MSFYEYTGDLLPSGAPIEDVASSAGEGYLAVVPRFKGGKKGSLFRYESPEQWGGAPISPRAGDVSLRVFDREKRHPVGEGVTVHFAARGAAWSHTSQTDAEGFAYAEDAPSVPIEATIEYGSRPTVLLHPSLTQTGRFRAVMAGGHMGEIAVSGWDLGQGRNKVRIVDRYTSKPIANHKIWFMTRGIPGRKTHPWTKKATTDSEGFATVEGAPAGQKIWIGFSYNKERYVRPLVAPGKKAGVKHPDRFHTIRVGDTMVVGSSYMGITPEAADLYPLVNGHERPMMSMGITPESADLYPLIEQRRSSVGASFSSPMYAHTVGDRMRGIHLGQKDISYVRVQVIDRNGNPIEDVRVLVSSIGEKRTGPDGVATIEVIGSNPGRDIIAFVALPEDTTNPIQVGMKTSTLTSTPLIVRSSSAAGTSLFTTAETIGSILGLGLLITAAVIVEKEATARPILFSIGGSIAAASTFSILSRNVK